MLLSSQVNSAALSAITISFSGGARDAKKNKKSKNATTYVKFLGVMLFAYIKRPAAYSASNFKYLHTTAFEYFALAFKELVPCFNVLY